MKRQVLWGGLDSADSSPNIQEDNYTHVTSIHLMPDGRTLGYGIGQTIDQLRRLGLHPSETGVDLILLSALVTAADTRISRKSESQDTWTREFDLYLPVSNVTLWDNVRNLLQKMLKFLTGDIWRINFRHRPDGFERLISNDGTFNLCPFSAVSLFSGGLDSYIGAIDLFNADVETPLFVSHYWDPSSTSNQEDCLRTIKTEYGRENTSNSINSRIGFDTGIVRGIKSEDTLRARSFLFFALAALAASCSDNIRTIYVPENGLISLNVPLDPLRLGAWSTRTTHPYYLARWNKLLNNLQLNTVMKNPYRFQTKGEMMKGCSNATLLSRTYMNTISCSSMGKGRWTGQIGHCGYCVPCLIRRASINHAYGSDLTGYVSVPNLNNTIVLNTKKAEGEHVRSFQLMKSKLSSSPNLNSILVHKSGPLNDYSAKEIQQYADVFKRGIDEVDAILNNVQAKPL